MEQTATEIMGRVCRRMREEPVVKQWLKAHPEIRKEMSVGVIATVEFDELA